MTNANRCPWSSHIPYLSLECVLEQCSCWKFHPKMPLGHGNLSLTNFDPLNLFSKTFYKVSVRVLAWRCTLKHSYCNFYKIQKLFWSHRMKICRTCSKVAQKADFTAVLALRKFLLSLVPHSFDVGYFGAL